MALVSNILTQVFITLIAVAGVYVLTGLTGMFSLGQAAFMAIGSYASGLLVVKAHMPLVPAIIIAVALATLVGYLIGYPVVRLRRDYISLVTLGFGEAIAALLNRMTSLTGGFGLYGNSAQDHTHHSRRVGCFGYRAGGFFQIKQIRATVHRA